MELSAETLKIVGAGRARMMRRATHASVGVAIVLIAIKIAAWIATGSVAMLTTLADSVLDLVASVVNLFAVRHALNRPTKNTASVMARPRPSPAWAKPS